MKRRDFVAGFAAAPLIGIGAAQAQGFRDRPIGLILVGVSWCEFCKGAASALQAATGPAELPLLVASQDGLPIAPIADVVDARGHPIASAVGNVPVLLFVHIPTQQVIAQIDGFRNPRAYLNRIRSTLLQAQEAGYA
ncbi:hypothetical protein M3484_16350 [Pseudomonas sp. GX19020]|uniref:hypothetical protein n=1 Tax=Pseudomonas sp. GX19020 TaxID=2942277 RepID=UPI002019FD26|nr:hypothetical protein [Pseudomonas sp. GX19020]MCL4068143.1 hypothetical protein [Pseudomonas sp. GX19020]